MAASRVQAFDRAHFTTWLGDQAAHAAMAPLAGCDVTNIPSHFVIHVVFTLPAEIAQIAYWNKKPVYDLLFKASAQTLTTIAADPRCLGAKIGMTSVLQTWGSALTHHPHVHIIVPGGVLSAKGVRWISCRPGFFLPVRVLSRLLRRLFLEGLAALHRTGKLAFFGELEDLQDHAAFSGYLSPLPKAEWVV